MNDQKVKFFDLPLGARFKYDVKDMAIWIKISNGDNGIVAEYDERYMKGHWVGQSICSFEETRKKMETREVWALE